jgi:hypothetical protein
MPDQKGGADSCCQSTERRDQVAGWRQRHVMRLHPHLGQMRLEGRHDRCSLLGRKPSGSRADTPSAISASANSDGESANWATRGRARSARSEKFGRALRVMEASLEFGEVRRAGFGEGQIACPPQSAVTGGNGVTEFRGAFSICTIPYGNIAKVDIGAYIGLRQARPYSTVMR